MVSLLFPSPTCQSLGEQHAWMLGTNGGTKVIAAAGVAGALILLRRALSKRALAAGRNKLDLQLPVPGDIEISQAVKLTPVRELFYDAFGLGDEELFSPRAVQGQALAQRKTS